MKRPAIGAVVMAHLALVGAGAQQKSSPRLFTTSDDCLACHNSLRTPSGEDVSIGSAWRASMMANSSRDPYWQAGVRRETLDHPAAAAAIEDECAICHMPMARTDAHARDRMGSVFSHLPIATRTDRDDRLAHDGVSCALCHQITADKLGTNESFTGGYVIKAGEPRASFGRFEVEKGLTTIMHSATEFQPAEALHIRQSELCATCHTLITKALGPNGDVIGELPEQMPYLEWRHGAFPAEERSCQSCHMPAVVEDTPIASVLGPPRKGLARHGFVGGNAFMLRMLNRYRGELSVTALPHELDHAVRETVENLRTATAAVSVERVEITDRRLNADVVVRNLTGHKLPTGYPSRRAWLHLIVRDRTGRLLFESGALSPSGSIQGNDNDADPTRFEPHYTEIRQSGQVQVYESIMNDPAGVPTTGLLTAVGYVKDNRLLPRGFEKASAAREIAVIGAAAQDADFSGGGDRLRYTVDVTGGDGPFQIDVELRFQSIAFRWAENLKKYDAAETRRFVGYYDAMAPVSSEILSRASVTTTNR